MKHDSHVNRYNLENFLKSPDCNLSQGERKGVEAIAQVGDGISVKSGTILDQISDKRGSAKVLMGRVKIKINEAGIGGVDTVIPRRKGKGNPGASKGHYILNLSNNDQSIRYN